MPLHSTELLIQVLVNGVGQCDLGDGTDNGFLLGPILEDHNGWNAADAVLSCDAWALICVELELWQGAISKDNQTSMMEMGS